MHGHKLGSPTKEEIKKVEDDQAIKEVSSSEEKDSEDDKAKDKKEEQEAEKTQEQDPKAADKAGESVKD